MDLRKVKKLIELAEEAGLAELEVTSGDESVRIALARRFLIFFRTISSCRLWRLENCFLRCRSMRTSR